MARPGPQRRPNLQVVREGNPGKRSREELDSGLRLAPGAPEEPDWLEWFPAVRKPTKKQLESAHPIDEIEGKPDLVKIDNDLKRTALAEAHQRYLIRRDRETAERAQKVNKRARAVARREWRRIVPPLDAVGLLTGIDWETLVDYCLVVAHIDQCVRDLSENGLWAYGERGAVKNPASTQLNQLRTQLKFYIGELGLSPVARNSLDAPEADDDGDSPFD
jgi:P27 family predicted phage terminase small subunit